MPCRIPEALTVDVTEEIMPRLAGPDVPVRDRQGVVAVDDPEPGIAPVVEVTQALPRDQWVGPRVTNPSLEGALPPPSAYAEVHPRLLPTTERRDPKSQDANDKA